MGAEKELVCSARHGNDLRRKGEYVEREESSKREYVKQEESCKEEYVERDLVIKSEYDEGAAIAPPSSKRIKTEQQLE